MNRDSCKFVVSSLILPLAACLYLPGAVGAENDELEEIVVMAQKVEENILDVPVAVSVIQGELLQERGATNLTDLDGIAPNVILKDVLLMENGGRFSIRGIGFFDVDPLSDQKTQIMVDGVPHARNTGVLYDQVDIQRVEILRGPQGTLFGRGSMAGTVNYVSRLAADEAGVSTRISAGEYGMTRYVLTAETGALIDGALRGSLTTSSRSYGGHLTNAFNGRTLGELDSRNTRLRLDHDMDFAQSSFMVYNLKDSSYGVGMSNQAQDPYGISDGDVDLINMDQDGFRESSERGFTFLSEIALTSGHVAVLANTHRSSFLTYLDLDGRAGLEPRAPPGYSNQSISWGFDIEQGQESIELRYHKEAGGRWDLVTGIFLFRENVERVFHQNFGPPLFETMAIEEAFRFAVAGQDTKSQAAFGQVEFHVSDVFSLIAGGRMTNEEKVADISTFSLSSPTPQSPTSRLSPAHTWEEPSWKLGMEYHPEDTTMVYLTASTGYKPGGFNGRATSLENAGPYAAEHSTSYEAGIKTTLLEGRLRLAAAGFFNDYTNIVGLTRRPTASGEGTEAVNDNIGEMTISGIELESSWLAATDLVFDFALGYLDAGWDTFASDINGDGIDTDNSHLDLMMAPHLSAYGAMTYSRHISDNTLQYRMDVRHQSRYNTFGLGNEDFYSRPATTKVNGSVTWIWGENQNSISVFGKNLTDRQPVSLAIVTIFPVMNFDAPRMFGAELKLNF